MFDARGLTSGRCGKDAYAGSQGEMPAQAHARRADLSGARWQGEKVVHGLVGVRIVRLKGLFGMQLVGVVLPTSWDSNRV